MGKISYLSGDLIALAKAGEFDVIVQGCNCFCTQGAGLAKQMVSAFDTLNPAKYPSEDPKRKGDINKLGTIEAFRHGILFNQLNNRFDKQVTVVNAYTQYRYTYEGKPFDIDAFTLIMRKLNKVYATRHIGLPKIGTHLAGGNWDEISAVIEKETPDLKITVVEWAQ